MVDYIDYHINDPRFVDSKIIMRNASTLDEIDPCKKLYTSSMYKKLKLIQDMFDKEAEERGLPKVKVALCAL